MEGPKTEGKEKYGHNVRVVVKFLRHGERRNDELTDAGAVQVREAAAESDLDGASFDMVKPVGSTAGHPQGEQLPTNESVNSARTPRSLVSAGIYAKEITQGYLNRLGELRPQNLLSYDVLKSSIPIPGDYNAFYNSFLPDNFSELSDDEKREANREAQTKVFDHILSLDTPEAKQYWHEVAGAAATLLLHYLGVSKKLFSNSEVLYVAGTHGGVMEFLILEAGEREKDGRREPIQSVEEIGGAFHTAESYNIEILRDENGGEPVACKVSFDSKERPFVDIYLDMKKVYELATEYLKIHSEEQRLTRTYNQRGDSTL